MVVARIATENTEGRGKSKTRHEGAQDKDYSKENYAWTRLGDVAFGYDKTYQTAKKVSESEAFCEAYEYTVTWFKQKLTISTDK